MLTFRETQKQLISILGFFWIKVFLDTDFVDAHTTSVGVQLKDMLNGIDTFRDYLSRLTLPIKKLHSTRIFIFSEGDLDRVSARYGDEGRVYGAGDLAYGQMETTLEVYTYPIDPNFEPEFLATTFLGDSKILKRGVDYTLSDGTISFKTDPLQNPGLEKRLFNNLDAEPVYQFLYWGFSIEEDISAICDYFGVIAGICGLSNVSWKLAMNIAWDLRVEGASVRNVNRLLAVLTDTDYVDEAGTVTAIYREGDRQCVQTLQRIYTAPLKAAVLVTTGQLIQPAQAIFDTYSITPGTRVISFENFEGLTLGQGFLHRLSTSGIFLPNVSTPITKTNATSFAFYVGGSAQDVDLFMQDLNSGSPSFFDALAAKYGKVPDDINPLNEIRDLYIGGNSFFIKTRRDCVDSKMATQLLCVLDKTINAGSDFFVIFEKTEVEETYDLNDVSESIGIFYAVTTSDTGMDIDETQIIAPRICG